MYFGGFLMRRPGSWPAWMAFRATATSVTAIVAALVLKSTAIPKLGEEMGRATGQGVPASLHWVIALQPWLPWIPVPALILGLSAIMVKPLRPVLAVLASAAALASIVLIVLSLVAPLSSMYQMPKDLDLGR